MTSTEIVADHRAAGRAFTAAGMTGIRPPIVPGFDHDHQP